jgi:hypothetical protein
VWQDRGRRERAKEFEEELTCFVRQDKRERERKECSFDVQTNVKKINVQLGIKLFSILDIFNKQK